jgi:hypothetical protein
MLTDGYAYTCWTLGADRFRGYGVMYTCRNMPCEKHGVRHPSAKGMNSHGGLGKGKTVEEAQNAAIAATLAECEQGA